MSDVGRCCWLQHFACRVVALALWSRFFEEKTKKVAGKFGGIRKSVYLCIRKCRETLHEARIGI